MMMVCRVKVFVLGDKYDDKKARELLGEEAEGLTDEEIEENIETAELFKNIFFSQINSLE